jgi:hypothetical protein
MTDTIEPLELDEDEKQQIAHGLVDQAKEPVGWTWTDPVGC